jgi:anti-sigma B factor antagonist
MRMSQRSDGRPTAFSVENCPLSGAGGVRVTGEVDLSTAPALNDALDAALAGTVGAFIIDLCDVDFFDSTGITALLRSRAILGRQDRQLVIVCPPGPVRRIFEIAAIDDLLTIMDTREAAAAALTPV